MHSLQQTRVKKSDTPPLLILRSNILFRDHTGGYTETSSTLYKKNVESFTNHPLTGQFCAMSLFWSVIVVVGLDWSGNVTCALAVPH